MSAALAGQISDSLDALLEAHQDYKRICDSYFASPEHRDRAAEKLRLTFVEFAQLIKEGT